MAARASQSRRDRSEDGKILSSLTALFVLVLAVGLALLGNGNTQLSVSVSALSASSGDFLQRVGAILPLGYAFAAGMAAAVNPCGFGLLPGYKAPYLRDAEDRRPGATARRFIRALTIGTSVTASFVALFGAVGILVSAAGALIIAALPWLSVAVGVMLVTSGARILTGSPLYLNTPESGGARVGRFAQRADLVGYGAYGLAFGLSSLSCTLPLFLTVVGSALALAGPRAGFFQFVLYALGMGFVLTVLAIVTALFGSSLARARAMGRYLEPVSAVLLLVSGAYLVYSMLVRS